MIILIIKLKLRLTYLSYLRTWQNQIYVEEYLASIHNDQAQGLTTSLDMEQKHLESSGRTSTGIAESRWAMSPPCDFHLHGSFNAGPRTMARGSRTVVAALIEL